MMPLCGAGLWKDTVTERRLHGVPHAGDLITLPRAAGRVRNLKRCQAIAMDRTVSKQGTEVCAEREVDAVG